MPLPPSTSTPSLPKSMSQPPIPIPITILTGFLGSGKTTLILNLLPQLPRGYKLALLKNELGDLAIDSKLASFASSSFFPSSPSPPSAFSSSSGVPGASASASGSNLSTAAPPPPPAAAISNVKELLGGCICCNLVGQLGDALEMLSEGVTVPPADGDESAVTSTTTTAQATISQRPDRIIIETSGSAFPATLAMEINRLSRLAPDRPGESGGKYVLDGVLHVIDVENWKGYEDTSYTARLQARFTDLIVFNKWEGDDGGGEGDKEASERRLDECRDRVGDLEVEVACVKSRRGWVDKEVLLGLDSRFAVAWGLDSDLDGNLGSDGLEAGRKGEGESGHTGHSHDHGVEESHLDEVEVLSVRMEIVPEKEGGKIEEVDGDESGHPMGVDLESLETFLLSAPKDEIYRIKAIIMTSRHPTSSDGNPAALSNHEPAGNLFPYILNWAFGRWTFTNVHGDLAGMQKPCNGFTKSPAGYALRMTIILARYEAEKWKKQIEGGNVLRLERGSKSMLSVERLS